MQSDDAGTQEDISHAELTRLANSGSILVAWPEGQARYGDTEGNVHLLVVPAGGPAKTVVLPHEYTTDKIRHLFDIASTVNYHMLKAVKEAINGPADCGEDDFWI